MFPDNLLARSVLLTASRVLALVLAGACTTTSVTADAASSSAVAGSAAADTQYEPVPDAADTAHTIADAAATAADFASLARQCAPDVHPALLGRVASVESSGNPYAIGVVGGHLARQPTNLPEALATVNALDAGGWNYSMGLVQVNVHNLARHGQSAQGIFEPCTNLRTGATILKECYARAKPHFAQAVDAVPAALSCYYSGDLARGASYARKVAAAVPVTGLQGGVQPIEVVPDVRAPAAAGSPGRASAGSRSAERAPRPAQGGDAWFTTYGDDQEDGDADRPVQAAVGGVANGRVQSSKGTSATSDGDRQ
jgi:type IV secretion system protein VirB1